MIEFEISALGAMLEIGSIFFLPNSLVKCSAP